MNLRFILTILFLFLAAFICQPLISADNLENHTEQISPSPLLVKKGIEGNFKSKGPLIKTELSAFILQGKWKSDQIYIPDFDIITTKENKRLIPLLRLLDLLQASGKINDKVVEFKTETSSLTTVNILEKSIEADGKKLPLVIETGVSDVTNMGEIYISEEALKEIFKFDFLWSDAEYGYRIKYDNELELFKRPELPSMLSMDVQRIQEILPETEPPAHPEKSEGLLSFVQPELRTEFKYEKTEDKVKNILINTPRLTGWGEVFGGDYEIKLRQSIQYPNPSFGSFSGWIDRVLWTSKNDKILLTAGDTNVAFSELVAPSANIFGMSFKWFPESETKEVARDKFFRGRKGTFASLGVFEGYALIGSTVDLWINNRLIESKVVEDADGAPPGYGYYRFEGIGLLDKTLNDVKFVIKRPDGIAEEFHKEVLGTRQLLSQGQFAYTGAIGTHRQIEEDKLKAEGKFLGAQVLYGVNSAMTFGLTTAMQDKFAVFENQANNSSKMPQKYYLSPELRYKFLERFLLKSFAGLSYNPDNNSSSFAYLSDLGWYLKKSLLQAQFFSYDSDYSNGITSISDRGGYNFSTNCKILKKSSIKNGFLHIQDNISGKKARTQEKNIWTSALILDGVLPKSNIQLQVEHQTGNSINSPVGNMYTVDLASKATDKVDITGTYTFGDKLRRSFVDDLTSGIPISNIGSFYSFGTRIRANYRITPIWSISPTYWQSDAQEKIELSSYYTHYGKFSFRSRFVVDDNLLNSKKSFKEYIDFNMDKKGNNKWGIKLTFEEENNNYEASVYVTLKDLFLIRKGRPRRVSRFDITPKRGGVEGCVYLDINANGHREKNEPGLGNIGVLVDDRRTMESLNDGSFYISRNERKEFISVSIDTRILPSIYIPTQGVQKAYWKESVWTKVNLGLAILNSFSGRIKVKDNDGQEKNVSGARIILTPDDSTQEIKDSITAVDGSFYIGEIKPGNYIITVDDTTMPDNYKLKEPLSKIIIPETKEPFDIENYDINLEEKEIAEKSEENIEMEENKTEIPEIKEENIDKKEEKNNIKETFVLFNKKKVVLLSLSIVLFLIFILTIYYLIKINRHNDRSKP